MKRLLILTESKRRDETKEPMPAMERYQGVFANVVKKYLRDRAAASLPPDVAVYFVSTSRGLVSADEKTDYQPQYPGSFKARPLSPEETARIISQMKELMSREEFSEVYVNVGGNIRRVLSETDFGHRKIIFAEGGGPGPKAQHMISWLRGS